MYTHTHIMQEVKAYVVNPEHVLPGHALKPGYELREHRIPIPNDGADNAAEVYDYAINQLREKYPTLWHDPQFTAFNVCWAADGSLFVLAFVAWKYQYLAPKKQPQQRNPIDIQPRILNFN